MRKHILSPTAPPEKEHGDWLPLDVMTTAHLSSEDPLHPFEQALSPGRTGGWRAARPGVQTVRLIFDQPIHIKAIELLFVEFSEERAQEYLLSWARTEKDALQEIVRQQFNFNPVNASRQLEQYHVNLAHVGVLELQIDPDRGRGIAIASVEHLRIAAD